MLQFQHHTQRPLTTAHLAQTMTLLSLTSAELKQQIESELASNPALELIEERRCPICKKVLPRSGPCPVCSKPKNDASLEPVVYISPRDDFYSSGDRAIEDMPEEPISPVIDDLPTYVLKQIATELKQNQKLIAVHLLTNLNEDGFLSTPLMEIARYFHVSIAEVEEVQRMIQHADPLGVGSFSPREALLVQMEVLAETKDVPELAVLIIRDGMDLLSKRQYTELAKLFGVSLRQIQDAIHYVGENLNPYPGRTHWGDMRQPSAKASNVFHQPDIIISFLNDDQSNPVVVEIIMPIGGTLRVNPLFRKAVTQSDETTKEGLKSDLDRASLFVKCLQQRNHTMQRLMQRLVVLQRDYLIEGEKSMAPITRAQISRELEVHESTISRAVSGKAVQLPNRKIVPMSSFFDRSLSARTVLRDIIANETRPMSDTELMKKLKNEGFQVARRTVAKYRAMEGILPAHLRHHNA